MFLNKTELKEILNKIAFLKIATILIDKLLALAINEKDYWQIIKLKP